MRTYILFLSVVFNAQSLVAQSKKQIDTWLYDLPIRKSPEGIKKAIVKNDNFEEGLKSQTADARYSNATFKGKILNPFLPVSGQVDSAKLFLSIGKLNTTDGYSGNMKWLRFEYFSSDTLFLNKLFDSACTDLKNTAKEQKPTGHRTMNNEAVGAGISFVYINEPGQLRSISASRVRYASGKQSFSLNYSGSDD